MNVFGAYSRYYNLFYRDKDYAAEAAYVDGLIQRYRPGAASVLDLGCGTGRHAMLLARSGYLVAGVDRSQEMLTVAEKERALGDCVDRVSLYCGDIRTIRLEQTFDAVVSLFHVMSYQTSNADLKAAFMTARSHLAPGGLFLFDCWYGPAVLTDRPEVRVKRVEDSEIAVTRVVEPVMFATTNLVETHYQVFVRDKGSNAVEELQETHRMRYLFQPEVEMFLQEAGMTLVESAEWMTARQPGFDTWGVCFVARQIDRDVRQVVS